MIKRLTLYTLFFLIGATLTYTQKEAIYNYVVKALKEVKQKLNEEESPDKKSGLEYESRPRLTK